MKRGLDHQLCSPLLLGLQQPLTLWTWRSSIMGGKHVFGCCSTQVAPWEGKSPHVDWLTITWAGVQHTWICIVDCIMNVWDHLCYHGNAINAVITQIQRDIISRAYLSASSVSQLHMLGYESAYIWWSGGCSLSRIIHIIRWLEVRYQKHTHSKHIIVHIERYPCNLWEM